MAVRAFSAIDTGDPAAASGPSDMCGRPLERSATPASGDTGLPAGWIETVASTRVEGILGGQLDFDALGLDHLQGNDEAHLPPVAVDDSGRAVFTVNDEVFRVEADAITVYTQSGAHLVVDTQGFFLR